LNTAAKEKPANGFGTSNYLTLSPPPRDPAEQEVGVIKEQIMSQLQKNLGLLRNMRDTTPRNTVGKNMMPRVEIYSKSTVMSPKNKP
jgi:hypothetical protein